MTEGYITEMFNNLLRNEWIVLRTDEVAKKIAFSMKDQIHTTIKLIANKSQYPLKLLHPHM